MIGGTTDSHPELIGSNSGSWISSSPAWYRYQHLKRVASKETYLFLNIGNLLLRELILVERDFRHF